MFLMLTGDRRTAKRSDALPGSTEGGYGKPRVTPGAARRSKVPPKVAKFAERTPDAAFFPRMHLLNTTRPCDILGHEQNCNSERALAIVGYHLMKACVHTVGVIGLS